MKKKTARGRPRKHDETVPFSTRLPVDCYEVLGEKKTETLIAIIRASRQWKRRNKK